MSDMKLNPNPLDPPLPAPSGIAAMIMPRYPYPLENPLGVVQYNGFQEGAAQGVARGMIFGALCGVVAYWLVRRYV